MCLSLAWKKMRKYPVVDKCSSVQDIPEQLDMLWNNLADLNRAMKKKQLAWAFFKMQYQCKD
jgi:hypothetical protein